MAESWTWFLPQLGEICELLQNSNFTFVSDRQKGIIPVIANLFPNAEHRYCVKHIHENMKKRWNGNAYKELLWTAASTTTVPEFQKAMEKLKEFSKEAYEWLNLIPPQHWSRSHFSVRAKSDVLLNNMCEVFNGKLVGGRDKPIISTLEFAREYLMKRSYPLGQSAMFPPTILPPKNINTSGEPPKERKKSAAERDLLKIVKNGKLSREHKTVTCNKCNTKGHNSRSCTGPRVAKTNKRKVPTTGMDDTHGLLQVLRQTKGQRLRVLDLQVGKQQTKGRLQQLVVEYQRRQDQRRKSLT
ncbi:mutator type transposase [Tanacetum coccineum]